MPRLALLVIALAVAGCTDDAIAPRPPLAAYPPQLVVGPPPAHDFGSDSYQTGVFTGQETGARPDFACGEPAVNGARTCSGFLASDVDGTLLDATLQIPGTSSGARPVPLITLIHGYAGSKSSDGDIAKSLLDAGYAVLRYSTRGFGESWGRVNLVDTHAEVADLRSMIAQAVDVPREADGSFTLDAGAVAVTGASYGGGHSWLALLQPNFESREHRPVTIRTVVPIAAWSDLLYSLLPSGRENESLAPLGSPKLTFINGLYASGFDPLHNGTYPNYPEYFAAWHAWINAQEPNNLDPEYRSIEDGIAGYRSIWWQQGFWSQASTARVPVFLVQGFTDDLFPFPEAKRMMLALQTVDAGYPVTAYFGDIGHPRASNKPGEIDYVLGLIKQWLEYYLKGTGSPPAGVYAAITRPREEQTFDPGNVITVPTLGALATSSVTKSFPGAGVLVNPLTDPAGGFMWDPFVLEGFFQLESQGAPAPPESPLVPGSLLTYDVPVTELSGGGPLLIAGQPSVSLHAATSAYRVQLDVRLFDIGDGAKRLITRGTYTLESGAIGKPIGSADITIATYGNLWRAEADHTLRLELTNVDSPYITPSRVPSVTAVNQVRLAVPVR